MAEAYLGARAQPLKILPVAQYHRPRGNQHDQHGRPPEDEGREHREGDHRGHGGHDDIVGDQRQEHAGYHDEKRKLPAQRQDHPKVGGKALAALKAQVEGKNVAQHRCRAGREADIRRVGEQPPHKPDSQHALGDIMQPGQDPGPPAQEHHGIGGTQVARAMGAYVHAAQPGEIKRHVRAAEKVSDQHCRQIGEHAPTAFVFLCRFQYKMARDRLSRKRRLIFFPAPVGHEIKRNMKNCPLQYRPGDAILSPTT